MKSRLSKMLLLVLLGFGATTAVLASPAPVVTDAPLVPRAVTTVGYMSTGTTRGTTLWAPITLNGENLIITTSANIYRLCDPSLPCSFFICRSGYAVFSTTSIACGGASSTCSSYILASDISDISPLTNYWCDDITKTGGTIYRTTPNGSGSGLASATPSPSARSAASTPALATSTSAVTSNPTTKPSPSSSSTGNNIIPLPVSPTPDPTPKPTPIGAIVGGVIGGLAVLGAIAVGVIFFLRRKRNSSPPPSTTQYQQQGSLPPPGVQQVAHQEYYNSPPPQGYLPEKTPAMTGAEVYPHYGASGPSSPAPQYTSPMVGHTVPTGVNELPAQRM